MKTVHSIFWLYLFFTSDFYLCQGSYFSSLSVC